LPPLKSNRTATASEITFFGCCAADKKVVSTFCFIHFSGFVSLGLLLCTHGFGSPLNPHRQNDLVKRGRQVGAGRTHHRTGFDQGKGSWNRAT
jgi:hypothetical protein